MSFSKFRNIKQVLKKYPLELRQEAFLPESSRTLPDLLLENIRFSLETKGAQENEAFYAESLIFPILQQAWKEHRRLKLWSHQAMEYDAELFGEPDYLLAGIPEGVTSELITKPLLAVVEAKKEDFEKGWGQCLAEMIGCQKFNDAPTLPIYGIVATGLFWEFGRLLEQIFTRHTFSYSIHEPQQVYGLVSYIFAECERNLLSARSTQTTASETKRADQIHSSQEQGIA